MDSSDAWSRGRRPTGGGRVAPKRKAALRSYSEWHNAIAYADAKVLGSLGLPMKMVLSRGMQDIFD